MYRKILLATAAAIASMPAHAASDAATRFGAREDIQQISLSPDGKRVALVEAVAGRGNALVVVSLDDSSITPVMTSQGTTEHIGGCRWATSFRLICSIGFDINDGRTLLTYTRLITLDADGKNMKVLSARNPGYALQSVVGGGQVLDWQADAADGSILMSHTYVPEFSTGTVLTTSREGDGVDRVNTVTLKRDVVEQPRSGAIGYVSDGHGAIRIMRLRGTDNQGYSNASTSFLYRTKDSRAWKPLSSMIDKGSYTVGFEPVAVDRDKDVAYGYDAEGDHTGLFSMALDGSLKRELVFARPDVDISRLVQIGRQDRVVGVSFTTDRPEVEFFDAELKKLTLSLSKALPGHPLVTIIDASADENKLLLFAYSDIDPGHYYIFDKPTRHLAELLPARPQLAKTALATVKSISYPAADGTMIPAYLTLPPGSDGKNLPAIVMPHGGPESRDEWGFDWLAQFFANRGYAVLQPNFRGSTGFGIAFLNSNGFQHWETSVGDINDGGRWMKQQGYTKLAIVGWSYGGYAALQSAVVDPHLFGAIVAVAPVTDFDAWREEFAAFSNYKNVDVRIGRGPHVAAGSPARHADRFVAPVLMFHGDRDQNVAIGESRLMASRLKSAGKRVELVELGHLDHQLDDSTVRADMLDKMDGFLRQTLALPPAP
ncbi:S9 family peptidase [Sphingomonas sp. 28-63-12]|uniref:alpha/beta hydrolase family protein n=1 Tax=Sphingomonas sp. 28-63-12 TaxID=1970434 RepID=UPI000BC7D814|nr:MAG: S9 family peptidase [Sphingomonas sp. 28-63-12]